MKDEVEEYLSSYKSNEQGILSIASDGAKTLPIINEKLNPEEKLWGYRDHTLENEVVWSVALFQRIQKNYDWNGKKSK